MENLKNEKIFGLYPGNLNPANLEEISQMEEIDIWKMIDNRGGQIFYAMHDHHTNPDYRALTETQYALEYLVYQTRRFGVEISDAKAGQHVERSESYKVWFKYWYDFMNSMDPNTLNAFIEAKCNGQDVSEFLPKDSWKDHYCKTR